MDRQRDITVKTTVHASTCRMAFGRKDATCPRCQELLAGAAPRTWAYKTNDLQRAMEIRTHFDSAKHRTGGCGPVCTYGDW